MLKEKKKRQFYIKKMQKGKTKNKKRNTSNEENTCNPAIKREISRSGDHNSGNNNRKKKNPKKTQKASIL